MLNQHEEEKMEIILYSQSLRLDLTKVIKAR